MAKKAFVYDGTQWVDIAQSTTDLTNYANMTTTPISGFRNAIINGGMDVWQRGTSFTHTSGSFYTADRFSFFADGTGGTKTISQQSFTPGAGSISGYEPKFFWRFNQSAVPTSQTEIELTQPIEDVRTFAGQTVTISFWAKADASRTVTTRFRQIFGTGGSAFVDSATQNNSLTTSWQRFTHTVTVPSINGKTVSASNNSSLQLKFAFPSGVTQTIDIWGVQVEKESIATPFEQRPIGTELALCQRYYVSETCQVNGYTDQAGTPGLVRYFSVWLPVTMRTAPTAGNISGTTVAGAATVYGTPTARQISFSRSVGTSSVGTDLTSYNASAEL